LRPSAIAPVPTPIRSSSPVATTLPLNTPIEPVSVPGWATIASGAHRDEVAAGAGDVAHRRDHRLAVRAQLADLPPDHVRGHVRAAGTVDPQQHGLDVVGRPAAAQCARRPCRAGTDLGAERAAPAAALLDGAGDGDHRDRVPLAQPAGELARSRRPRVPGQVQQVGAVAVEGV
jgi:hypothetical protein